MAQAIVMNKFEYNQQSAHEDFPEWKFMFENFLSLSGIVHTQTTADEGAIAGATRAFQNLIHAGGPLAYKLLRTFDDPSVVTYAQLILKMEEYCAPKNTASLLYKFDTLRQRDDEKVQDFIIRLRPIGVAAGISSTNIACEIFNTLTI